VRAEGKMMREATVVLIVASWFVTYARANDVVSGMQLLEACQYKDDKVLEAICSSYINGFVAGLAILSSQYKDNFKVCFPQNSTGTQAQMIIVNYMAAHPEQLHFPASLIMGNALHIAFKCPDPEVK
jgi:hypothetical protein